MIMAEFGTLKQTLTCQISCRWLYSIALYSIALEKQKKNEILPHYQLRHRVAAPPSGVETKLNVGEQLQALPYPKISKSLLSFNAL